MSPNAHSERANIAEVARRAGVSIATVSRAINRTAVVSDETLERVQSAIRELNYVPHGAARSLARGRTSVLGLLVPEISGEFFVPLLRGIETAAREHNFDLVIHSTQRQALHTAWSSLPVGEHNTDGLLVFIGSLGEAEIARLYRLRFPVVLLHQTPPASQNIPFVTFENKDGTRQMIDHLIEVHGYRRIAFLRGPQEHEDSYWRETGYRASLEVHQIPIENRLIGQGDFNAAVAELNIQAWIDAGLFRHGPGKSNHAIQAVFAGDDTAAFGVMRALQQNGFHVPEDVAVVGFDDQPFSQFTTPSLTTVHAPIQQAGYEAVCQLVRLIQNGEAQAKTLLPTQLLIRRSCGCEADRAVEGGES